MRSFTRRLVPPAVVLALTGTALVAGTAVTADAAATTAAVAVKAKTKAKAKPVKTGFGLSAVAIGTRVIGGSVPLTSDQTGAQTLSCTNVAGLARRNYVAAAEVPGLGTVEGVSSRAWTTKRGGVVSSRSQHALAKVTLEGSPGALDLEGIASTARAWHDAKGFHGSHSTKIASVTYRPADGGRPRELEVPTPGRPLWVPGIARISVGVGKDIATRHGAEARTSVLDIRVIPSETKVLIAQSKAYISDGIKSGVFQGSALGLRGTALSDVIGLGATPLVHMPCRGTRGKVRTERVAGVTLPGALSVSGLSAAVLGGQNKRRASARETARVAQVDLGDGRLVINGISAVGEVSRTKKGRYTRSSEGTGVLQLLVDGEPHDVIPDEAIEIPGLVKIENSLVTEKRRGLTVVAVRLTLLDGSGAVIELGVVDLGIRGSGRRR